MKKENRLLNFAMERLPEGGSKKGPEKRPKTSEELKAEKDRIERMKKRRKEIKEREAKERKKDWVKALEELEKLEAEEDVSYELSVKALEIFEQRDSAKDKLGSLKDLLKGTSNVAEVYGIRYKEDKDKLFAKTTTSDEYVKVDPENFETFIRLMQSSVERGLPGLPYKPSEMIEAEEEEKKPEEKAEISKEPAGEEKEEKTEEVMELEPINTVEEEKGINWKVVEDYLRRYEDVKNYGKIGDKLYTVRRFSMEVDPSGEGLHDFLEKRGEKAEMIHVTDEKGKTVTYIWNGKNYESVPKGNKLAFDRDKGYRVAVGIYRPEYRPGAEIAEKIPKKRNYLEVENGQYIIGKGKSSMRDFREFLKDKSGKSLEKYSVVTLKDLDSKKEESLMWNSKNNNYEYVVSGKTVKLSPSRQYRVRPEVPA